VAVVYHCRSAAPGALEGDEDVAVRPCTIFQNKNRMTILFCILLTVLGERVSLLQHAPEGAALGRDQHILLPCEMEKASARLE
jgi:hypothetical protein